MRGKLLLIWLGVFAAGFSDLVGATSYYEVKPGRNGLHSEVLIIGTQL